MIGEIRFSFKSLIIVLLVVIILGLAYENVQLRIFKQVIDNKVSATQNAQSIQGVVNYLNQQVQAQKQVQEKPIER